MHPAAWDNEPAESARDHGRRPRHARDAAHHLERPRLRHLAAPVRLDPVLVSAHGRRSASTATNVPTLGDARREHVDVYDRHGRPGRTSCAAACGARRSPACSMWTRPRCRRTSTGRGARTASRSAGSGRGRIRTVTARSSRTATWASAASSRAARRTRNGGLNMADFVLGYPNSYRGGGSQINNAWVQSPGFYAARRVAGEPPSDAELRPALGAVLRARRTPTASTRRSSATNFDKGIRSTVYANAPVGLVFPGDPGLPDQQVPTPRTT